MSFLLGANWRTTLSGILAAVTSLLTVMAALPYELGEAATLFPPEWKARIAVAGAIATVILRAINAATAKDAAISGNGTLDDPVRKSTGDGRSKLVSLYLLCAAAGVSAAGCVTIAGSLSFDDQKGNRLTIGVRGDDSGGDGKRMLEGLAK